MRTTVILDDNLSKKIKEMAHKNHKTFKDTLIDLVQLGLHLKKTKRTALKFKMKTFKSGGATVPIHDRNALFEQMDKTL